MRKMFFLISCIFCIQLYAPPLLAKPLEIIVGFSPGGGFDSYARNVAYHLEKVLQEPVIVRNVPGGGGMVALNTFVKESASGSMILTYMSENVQNQLFGREGIKYDASKLRVVGKIDKIMTPKLIMNSKYSAPFKDMKLGSMPPGSIGGNLTSLYLYMLEYKENDVRIITGYKGMNEVVLGTLSGELDGFVSSLLGMKVKDDPNYRIIMTLDKNRDPIFPDTPTIYEVMNVDPKRESLLTFYQYTQNLGRSLVMHPDTPEEDLLRMRKVLGSIMTLPEVIKDFENKNIPIDWEDGSSIEKLSQDLFNISPSTIEEIQRVYLNYYFKQ